MEALDSLAQAQLGTGATAIFTADSQPSNYKVRCILWICNTDTAERTVTIRYGTGTLTSANSLFDGTVMSAGKVYIAPAHGSWLTLKAGYKIEGLSDAASKITVTVFGYRVFD